MVKHFSKINLIMFTIAIFATSSCATSSPNPQKKENPLPPPLSEYEIQLLKMIGAELLPDGNIKIGNVFIDRKNMEIFFPAEVNMREGDLEVLICTPTGRMHESLLLSKADPFHLQLALILLGAENGLRIEGGHLPQGTILDIDVQVEGSNMRHPIEKWLLDKKTNQQKKNEGWVFVGSSFTHNGICLASEEGNLVNIWSFGNTILDNPSPDAIYDDLISVFTENTPPVDTKVTVFLKIRK